MIQSTTQCAIQCYSRCAQKLDQYVQPVLLLAIRIYISTVFFRAGWVKIQDWGSTLALFRDEYKVPLLPPDMAAVMGAGGELFFPILLVLGLFSRFAAFGLFIVNAMAIISYPQLFEFDCPAAIRDHFFWGALMLIIFALGPGKLALDRYLKTESA